MFLLTYSIQGPDHLSAQPLIIVTQILYSGRNSKEPCHGQSKVVNEKNDTFTHLKFLSSDAIFFLSRFRFTLHFAQNYQFSIGRQNFQISEKGKNSNNLLREITCFF